MEKLIPFLQIIVALGIYNVWFIRPKRKTDYRGRGASSLKEEFMSYGLSVSSMYLVGAIKVLSATALLLGLLYPALTKPAAAVLSVMMVGAISMHFKVGDNLKRFVPAVLMLAMSVTIFFLS
jgi:uncharacterized membrane protein YphA (DoxX/SURF4 family)